VRPNRGHWVSAHGEAVLPAKKYAVWAVAAFAVLYMVKAPKDAASAVQHAASGLSSVADSLSTFVNKLAT
jgi:hypothetical protein